MYIHRYALDSVLGVYVCIYIGMHLVVRLVCMAGNMNYRWGGAALEKWQSWNMMRGGTIWY